MRITKEGYEVKTVRLTASEINNYVVTSTGYRIIRLKGSSYSGKDDIFVGGLYKYDGTYIKESKFDDVTKNYYMFVSDNYERTLKYNTNYNNANQTITLDASNTGTISLRSGIQFDDENNNSFILNIYADGSLVYEIPINFTASEEVVNIDVSGLYNNEIFRNMVFIGIIVLAVGVSIMTHRGEGDAGLHTFMMGCLISPMIVGGLTWLAWISGLFYTGKLIKRWFSE